MINKRMNYKKHYTLLIERAKNRVLDEYVEKHHIVPRCLGGSNNRENIVALTPEEHYVAHQLLVKMYPKEHKLVYAANMMTVGTENVNRSNNKRYKWLRERYISACRTRVGEQNPSYGKSWYYNPDTLENGKFIKENAPAGWIKGRKLSRKYCSICSIEIDTRDAKQCVSCRNSRRVSKAPKKTRSLKGVAKSDSTRKKMSLAQTGKTLSAETRKKISKASASRPPISNETRQKLSDAAKTAKNKSAGTIWITNGTKNKRISKETIIPKDWHKGRS